MFCVPALAFATCSPDQLQQRNREALSVPFYVYGSLASASTLKMTSEKSDEVVKEAVKEDEEKEEALDENTTRKRSSEAVDNDDPKRVRSDVLDKAVELGFKAGDRIEVEWEIGTDENVTTRWWGGTLLEHDGRTAEGVAIRVIEYDPFPEGGFPERSKEDVVFVAQYILLDPVTGDELHFRRDGEEATVTFSDEDLDTMLMNVFHKHGDAFRKLSAAQQANVADVIVQGKERLLAAITSRWEAQPGKVITSEEVPEIMEQAFRDM